MFFFFGNSATTKLFTSFHFIHHIIYLSTILCRFFTWKVNRPCVSPYFVWIVTKYLFQCHSHTIYNDGKGINNLFKNRDLYFNDFWSFRERRKRNRNVILFIHHKQIDRPHYYMMHNTFMCTMHILGIMHNIIWCSLLWFIFRHRITY